MPRPGRAEYGEQAAVATLLNPPHPAPAPPGPVICCAHLLRIDTSIVHCQHPRYETQMIRANFNIHRHMRDLTWISFRNEKKVAFGLRGQQ